MRDLFDDFMEELRKREAIARGQDPDAAGRRRPSEADRDKAGGDDGSDEATAAVDEDRANDLDDERADDLGDEAADDAQPEEPTALHGDRTTGGRGGGRGRRRRRGPGGPDDGGPGRAARVGRRIGVGIAIAAVIAIFLLFSFGIGLW